MVTKREQKQREIVREATRLFNARGYTNTSMADLGAAVGLQDGSLYHYFTNKHAIALACHQAALQVSIRCINNARKYDGTAWQQLRHMIFCFFLESAENGPNIYAGDLSYLDATNRSRIEADRTTFIEQVTQFVRAGIADKSMFVPDAATAGEAACAILFWLPKWTPPSTQKSEAFAPTVIETIAGLLGAEQTGRAEQKLRTG